jgi:hypothetical protein
MKIEHEYSCEIGTRNAVSIPYKGFLVTNSFRSVSCYCVCVAFLDLPMEGIMDSVLT